jgi:hypothetical protein
MKRALLAFVLACGGSQPSVTLPSAPSPSASTVAAAPRPDPLPAGACGFDGTLAQACITAPRWAVIARMAHGESEATQALARARTLPLVAGYPFAAHSEELPTADFRPGVAIVLGLFLKEADARDEAKVLGAEAVELATREKYRERWPDFDEHHSAIEMLEDAPAFEERAVRELARTAHGPLKKDVDERIAFARDHASVCRAHRGDVFVALRRTIQEFSYGWVPVRCGDVDAFVDERATRFEAVVKHDRPPMIWQVVQVMCAPTMESRAFGVPPGRLGETHMDDDCD